MPSLVDLGDVYAFLHDELRPGASNSGIVVDDDGLTIIDAQLTPRLGAELAQLAESMERPIRRLAVTSSHMPFVGGSSAFVLPAVYGTGQVSAHLDQPANMATCYALYPDDAAELSPIEETGCRRVTHTVREGAWLSARVVAAPLSGELDENLIVQVPDAQVVFGGAMCSFGVVPMAGLGNPLAWADALDTLLQWGEIFVPGHGPIGGREEVESLQAYLRACHAAAGDPGALADGPWKEWPGQQYHRVNIDRAAALAGGDPTPQPSMIALLGLDGLPPES
ncbi:MAG: hypothetical protein AAF567_21765 [Actinomycetota bacterium]